MNFLPRVGHKIYKLKIRYKRKQNGFWFFLEELTVLIDYVINWILPKCGNESRIKTARNEWQIRLSVQAIPEINSKIFDQVFSILKYSTQMQMHMST